MTDTRNDKVPVYRCVADAYQVLRDDWLRFVPAAAIVSSINTATLALAGGPALETAFAILNIFAGIAFSAAVLRRVLFSEFARPIGLKLGIDEFRLVGVTAAVWLLILPAAFLISIIGFSILAARLDMTEAQMQIAAENPEQLIEAMAQTLRPADGLVALALALPALWLAAKLFLASPATIGERRITILKTWKWSAGNSWRIVAAMVLAVMPALAFGVVAVAMMGAIAPDQLVVTLPLRAVIGAISALLQIPLIALSAILYRGLRPPTIEP